MREGLLITYRVMYLSAEGYKIAFVKATSNKSAKRAFHQENDGTVIQTSRAEW